MIQNNLLKTNQNFELTLLPPIPPNPVACLDEKLCTLMEFIEPNGELNALDIGVVFWELFARFPVKKNENTDQLAGIGAYIVQ